MPTAQMGSVTPQGVKKKKQLYAPYVQESAKAGVATQMVMDRKGNEATAEAKGLQEEQFKFQQDQAVADDAQWQRIMSCKNRVCSKVISNSKR